MLQKTDEPIVGDAIENNLISALTIHPASPIVISGHGLANSSRQFLPAQTPENCPRSPLHINGVQDLGNRAPRHLARGLRPWGMSSSRDLLHFYRFRAQSRKIGRQWMLWGYPACPASACEDCAFSICRRPEEPRPREDLRARLPLCGNTRHAKLPGSAWPAHDSQ